MRKVLWIIASLIVVVLGAVGGLLAFDAPIKPSPLASVSDPIANVDFSRSAGGTELFRARRRQARLSGL